MSVSCECCVLSGRGLCVGLITRPEESYRVRCVSECDREASTMRRPWPHWGLLRHGGKNCFNEYIL
jgi:coenzyme F420-reducing hydrogenase gamma subunit